MEKEESMLLSEVATTPPRLTEGQEIRLALLDRWVDSITQALDDTKNPQIGAFKAVWDHHDRMGVSYGKNRNK